ncbi:MAG: hypothetical protein AAF483_11955 [Planctomycetota bacterium]
MSEEFDPYHIWLGIPPDQQPPNHYRLLGLELYESNADVIDAAASRQTAYLHTLASGPNRKASQQILTEVAAARRCLLDATAKATYDEQLRSSLAPANPPASAAEKSSLSSPTPNPAKASSPNVVGSDAAQAPRPKFNMEKPSKAEQRAAKKRKGKRESAEEPLETKTPSSERRASRRKKSNFNPLILSIGSGTILLVCIIYIIVNKTSPPPKIAPEINERKVGVSSGLPQIDMGTTPKQGNKPDATGKQAGNANPGNKNQTAGKGSAKKNKNNTPKNQGNTNKGNGSNGNAKKGSAYASPNNKQSGGKNGGPNTPKNNQQNPEDESK